MIDLKLFTPAQLRQYKKLIADIKDFQKRIKDREAMLQHVKKHMIERWAVNFTKEGELYGKWKPLSASWTVIERGSTGPMLVRSGRHFASFVTMNEAGKVNNQAVTWNFRNQPGAWLVAHHLGIPNPLPNRDDIGPRTLWDVNEEDQSDIREILEDEIDVAIKVTFG